MNGGGRGGRKDKSEEVVESEGDDEDESGGIDAFALLSEWTGAHNPLGLRISPGERDGRGRGLRVVCPIPTSPDAGGGGGELIEEGSKFLPSPSPWPSLSPSHPPLLLLPWKHALGSRSAIDLIAYEQSRGRSVAADYDSLYDFVSTLVSACGIGSESGGGSGGGGGNSERPRLWSCVMASAILTALRYPLSSWCPFVSCLPGAGRGGERGGAGAGRVDAALKHCHAETARYALKRRMSDATTASEGSEGAVTTTGRRRLSLDELRRCSEHRDAVLASDPGDTLEHVLLWSDEDLLATGDVSLVRAVTADKMWLREVWIIAFHRSNSKKDPIVSWESWLWAHAIVRSRAVGMPLAPRSVLSCRVEREKEEEEEERGEGERRRAPPLLEIEGNGVLLPIVDLVNHAPSGGGANASLELRPGGVAVVASSSLSPSRCSRGGEPIIPAGGEVLFDYHPGEELRGFLRGYGFVDCGQGWVVRQTFPVGGMRIRLDVRCRLLSPPTTVGGWAGGGSMMRVADVARGRGGGVVIYLRDDDGIRRDNEDQDKDVGENRKKRNSMFRPRCGGRGGCGDRSQEWHVFPILNARAAERLDGGQGRGDRVVRVGAVANAVAGPFADEGRACAAAVVCCRIALDGMEALREAAGRHGGWKGETAGKIGAAEARGVANEYYLVNEAILRRCVDDLTVLEKMLELD